MNAGAVVVAGVEPGFVVAYRWKSIDDLFLGFLFLEGPWGQIIDMYLMPKGRKKYGVSYREVAFGISRWLQACSWQGAIL